MKIKWKSTLKMSRETVKLYNYPSKFTISSLYVPVYINKFYDQMSDAKNRLISITVIWIFHLLWILILLDIFIDKYCYTPNICIPSLEVYHCNDKMVAFHYTVKNVLHLLALLMTSALTFVNCLFVYLAYMMFALWTAVTFCRLCFVA